jgi:hypothetical protein
MLLLIAFSKAPAISSASLAASSLFSELEADTDDTAASVL